MEHEVGLEGSSAEKIAQMVEQFSVTGKLLSLTKKESDVNKVKVGNFIIDLD